MTPMLGEEPGRKQSPASWAATARSIASTPASIRAVLAPRSISIPRMRSVLITIVSSSVPTGAAPCPVVWPRTLSSMRGGVPDHCSNVVGAFGERNCGGVLIDGEVPGLAGLVPVRVSRGRDPARQREFGEWAH